MHKTTLYLEPELYQRVQRRARSEGATQAAIIRKALAAYLAAPLPMPRSVGLGRSKRRNLSERAEELLEGFGVDRCGSFRSMPCARHSQERPGLRRFGPRV